MKRVFERLAVAIASSDVVKQRLLLRCHEELGESERVHLDLALFRRHDYAFHVLANRDERTRLDVVVAPVRDEVLDGLASAGKALHLVKDDEGLAREQTRAILQRENLEEAVEIAQVLVEVVPHDPRGAGEVDEDVGAVVLARELLDDRGLADAPGAFDQQRRAPLGLFLPRKKLAVDVSVQFHASLLAAATRETVNAQSTNCPKYRLCAEYQCAEMPSMRRVRER